MLSKHTKHDNTVLMRNECSQDDNFTAKLMPILSAYFYICVHLSFDTIVLQLKLSTSAFVLFMYIKLVLLEK